MQKFMQTHKIFLTPLSPIHIGCGEDFEPTNYIIDNQTLYNFDPSHLNLSEKQQQDLLVYSNRLDLLAIQRFFIENKQKALEVSDYISNVAQGVATDYQNKVGKVVQREQNGNRVITNLAIERTSFLLYQNEPYIPGSSFKGALVTALLDMHHNKRGNPKILSKNDGKKLLKSYIGTFKDSKLRGVKFSDFIPVNTAYSKIYYSINYKKKKDEKGGMGKGITTRRECIVAGQYRAFVSDLSLWNDMNFTVIDFIKSLNEYYKPIFKEECNLLIERTLIQKDWVIQIMKLLADNNVALIRLGKNGGDSKVYRGDGVAQIFGKKNKDRSTTLWLAGDKSKQNSNLLPFGWALIEFDANSDNESLKQWCETQSQDIKSFDKIKILRQKEQRLADIREKQAEEEAKLRAIAKQKAAEEKAKQALFESATENQQAILLFVDKIQSTSERQIDTSGSPLLKEALTIITEAVTSWTEEDKNYLKEYITVDLLKSKVDFKKKDTEKNLKKQFNKLVNP